MNEYIVKWVAITIIVIAISMAFADMIRSEARSTTDQATAINSWSKIVVACLEAGHNDCNEKYKMSIR